MQRDPAALKAALADLEQRNLKRRRRGALGGLVNFCSNDYLGLKDHAEVTRAFIEAASTYGVGSGASHLVSGHGPGCSHTHAPARPGAACNATRQR